MLMNRLTTLALPLATRYLIDSVVLPRQPNRLPMLVAIICAALVVEVLSSFALTQVLGTAAFRLMAEVREQLQTHVFRLPTSFYDVNKAGSLVARVINDTDTVRNIVETGIIEFIGAIVTSSVSLFFLFRLNIVMTFVIVFILAIYGVGLYVALQLLHPLFRRASELNSEVIGRFTESINGIRLIKILCAERRESQIFAEGLTQVVGICLRTLKATSLLNVSGTAIVGVLSVIVMIIGTREIFRGSMTLGSLVTYGLFLGLLISPVLQIIGLAPHVGHALAGLERADELLEETPEDADPERTETLTAIKGRVSFEHITFAYEGDRIVLEDISFVARPGTLTALVGPSGSGKSTAMALLAGLYVCKNGSISIDDVDISRVRLSSLRERVSVVLQDTFLFDGTLEQNVTLSKPSASTDEVVRACRSAGLDEFADVLGQNCATLVGERGARLSGGQRQRISIARALLAESPILILDEATSSLDSTSEELIHQAVKELMSDRTTFVVAHRLSTIRHADQILVFSKGRIVERGTHDELLSRPGTYHRLWTTQHNRG
jgi:ABC-type multidrug transport system fused ATPase/permease subunit